MNIERLLSIIERKRQGLSVESSNLDLKRKWWNLSSSEGKWEFIKDICSMANTPTGDSSIIIGVKSNGSLVDSPLPMDEANIQSIYKDKVNPKPLLEIREFDMEGKKISVVNIPHSKNRPHVISKYKGKDRAWIPIRVGTSTQSALKADLDEMSREQYSSNAKLIVSFAEKKVRWDNYAEYGDSSFLVRLRIDNYEGTAPDYITNVSLIETTGDKWESKFFRFGGLNTGQALLIEAKELKEVVPVYLSDQPPVNLRNHRKRPNIDIDSLILQVFTRSGQTVRLEIKPGWIEG